MPATVRSPTQTSEVCRTHRNHRHDRRRQRRHGRRRSRPPDDHELLNDFAEALTVELSSAGQVLFPEPQITKGDLVGYYRDIASRMLPYLGRRPPHARRRHAQCLRAGRRRALFGARRPGATVATPLRWEELEDPGLTPQEFTLRTVGGNRPPWHQIPGHEHGFAADRVRLSPVRSPHLCRAGPFFFVMADFIQSANSICRL
jgi:hypothetical protein